MALLLILAPALAGILIIGGGFILPAVVGTASGAIFYLKRDQKEAEPAEPVE